MELKDNKKTQTMITYYHGLTSIGGTYVEVQYGNSRIVFDCGCEFDGELDSQPKTLEDLYQLKMIPKINYLFEKKDNLNTAVFVSHAHLDHSKAINFVDKSIPIYMSKETKKLIEALNVDNDFLISNYKINNNTRALQGIDFNKTIRIGEIAVTILPVDHDVVGASGFIIKTPDCKIAYTGDLRLHGLHPEYTEAFCLAAKNCDILIMEGVSVSFQTLEDAMWHPYYKSEKQLINEIAKMINEKDDENLSFNFYIGNLERILYLEKIINRPIILKAHDAYVFKQMYNKNFLYYCVDGNDYNLSKKYQCDLNKLNPRKQLIQYDDSLLNLINDGYYFNSNAAPFTFEKKYPEFIEKLEKHNIKLINCNCSGHAYPIDLYKIIEMIKPKLLTPLHSYHPERLKNIFGEVMLPYKGQTIKQGGSDEI